MPRIDWAKLETFDRRWIFVAMLLSVLLPLLFPLKLPFRVQEKVRRVHEITLRAQLRINSQHQNSGRSGRRFRIAFEDLIDIRPARVGQGKGCRRSRRL